MFWPYSSTRIFVNSASCVTLWSWLPDTRMRCQHDKLPICPGQMLACCHVWAEKGDWTCPDLGKPCWISYPGLEGCYSTQKWSPLFSPFFNRFEWVCPRLLQFTSYFMADRWETWYGYTLLSRSEYRSKSWLAQHWRVKKKT